MTEQTNERYTGGRSFYVEFKCFFFTVFDQTKLESTETNSLSYQFLILIYPLLLPLSLVFIFLLFHLLSFAG
jgi:hypothetical protein